MNKSIQFVKFTITLNAYDLSRVILLKNTLRGLFKNRKIMLIKA